MGKWELEKEILGMRRDGGNTQIYCGRHTSLFMRYWIKIN
jgi:hypothetical protein